MAIAVESNISLHIEECNFEWNILSDLSNCINYALIAKYKTEKLIAIKTFFKF